MSSPTQTPYYRPRPRSIVGPLVLITIGVLFLLRTTGVISFQSFRGWMVHYWPLLLIIWGVAKLLEHIWARQRGEPTPRLGGGAITFLVFFILCSMTFSKANGVNWGIVMRDWGVDDWPLDWNLGNSYDFTQDLAQALPGATQVKIV